MKTYIKPQLTTINIRPLSVLAASGDRTETMTFGGSGGNNTYGDGGDLTREKRGGVGGGLWSDMK